MRVAFALCLLAVALSAPAHAESGQWKIRPLDPNNAADQKEIIRWLDPSGTANPDELMRTFIDVDKRFRATNHDIKAAGLWQADYTTPNNVHFTVIADYGVKKTRVHYRFYIRHECEKARAIAQGHGFEAEECSSAPLPPPAINIRYRLTMEATRCPICGTRQGQAQASKEGERRLAHL